MSHTRQRKAILEVLHESGRPLTRAEILRKGRELVGRLGSATVDRAIREMSAKSSIIGVEFPGQPRRYELPSECEHPHFICRDCERVYDLPVKMHLPRVKDPRGFNIQGGEVIYSGTCPDCQ